MTGDDRIRDARIGDARIPVIVLTGPTAVGKTALAIALAQALNGAIVSADSRQIYQFMDIGTAKPTPTEQVAAPHHLIDVIPPDRTLSAAEWQTLAAAAIRDIHQRGRLPLLVGGTGQYITALLEGWTIPEVPPDPALRAALEADAARDPVALYARLQTADPAAAALIHPNNHRRVIRALEVIALTGQPFSAQRRKVPPPYRVQQFELTLARDRLYQRADRRVEAMIAAGFAAEVRDLLARGYDRRLPALSGLGYSQLAAHWLDDLPLADAIAQTKTATHDFIRRQLTWFRHHDHGLPITRLDAAALDPAAVSTAISGWLAHPDHAPEERS